MYNFAQMLKNAHLDYENYLGIHVNKEHGEHPMTFENYACMHYGIPKSIAQQYVAEKFDV